MDINLLIKLVGAVGVEKYVIQGIVSNLGMDTLMEHIDAIDISNKTKTALQQLKILLNNQDMISSVSSLTEIPVKTLKQEYHSKSDIQQLIMHPEKIDIDHRQFEKMKQLQSVYVSYYLDKEKAAYEDDGILESQENEMEP